MIMSKLKIINKNELLKILKKVENSGINLRYFEWLNIYKDNEDIFKKAYEIISFIDNGIILEYLLILIKQYNEFGIPYLKKFIDSNNLILNRKKIKIEIIKYFTYLKEKNSLYWIETKLFDINKDVKLEAIKAVKKIGNIKSIEKLKKLTGKKYSNIIRHKALDAISYIQSGIPDKTKGALMLAEEELHGELSIQEETGQLSNTDENNKI